jgi:hypothetical protein
LAARPLRGLRGVALVFGNGGYAQDPRTRRQVELVHQGLRNEGLG